MGRKSVVHQYNMFEGQSVDMSGNLTSNISNVEHMDKISIHCSWTAGPAGEFKLYARNGVKAGNTDSWYQLDFGQNITITGLDSEIQILLNECPFTEIQLRYVASSGSATDLKANLTAKTVGS